MIVTFIQTIQDDKKRDVVEEIYDRYYKHMMACAMSILKNAHDSQDAVQEAFYHIVSTSELFENASSQATAALVHIYVKHAAINLFRKNTRQSKVVLLCDNVESIAKDVSAEDSDIERIMIDGETAAIVSTAVDKLAPLYRDLVIMKYYYHMRNIDIAQVLKIDSNTVNNRIFRAKQKLKEILGPEAYERITR